MSQSKDHHEATRWLSTAQDDLRAARALRDSAMYAHACFNAQQSAEKALKAIWKLHGLDGWGHSIQRLIMDFPHPDLFQNRADWLQRAAILDRFYIPTRYPDSLPDLTPAQSYFLADADTAIQHAEFFLQAAQEFLFPPNT
jgi:HEPN domain-containing protein